MTLTEQQKKEIQGMIEEEVRVMMIDGRHDVEGPNNTIRFVSCRELLIRLRPRYSYDDALLFCLQMRSMNKTMGEYESELPTVSDFRIASAEDTALLESEIERVSSAARRPRGPRGSPWGCCDNASGQQEASVPQRHTRLHTRQWGRFSKRAAETHHQI